MKKATFVNLIIIISLLILCVMTLLAVYATAPDSSVLLLDENFNNLDESKWKHEISECKEEGGQYHYVMENEENRSTADGVLLIHSNLTEAQHKSKREAARNCMSCINSTNSTADCVPSLFAAKLQSKNVFNAIWGRIEVRAKLRSENLMRFYIKITPVRNDWEAEKGSKTFLKSTNETSTNNSAEFEIFFETASNKAVIKRGITDDEFHVYEITWDAEKISLNVDREEVCKKEFKMPESQGENISNNTIKFNGTPISEPFQLNFGVDVQEKKEENSRNRTNKGSSFEDSAYRDEKDLKEERAFEMDYIRLFRILN